jgi:hypothetical protein
LIGVLEKAQLLLTDLAEFYFRIWRDFGSAFGMILLPDLAAF